MRLLSRFIQLLRVHWMLAVSAFAALISMGIVPPDSEYLGYFDWKTIGCLFCVLAVAGALRNAGFFDWIARQAINGLRSPQKLVAALVLITAVFSMVFTNDIALVIMLPLTVAVLVKLDFVQLVGPTFVLQALSANLCGMITPFGNPQNIYLFTYYNIGVGAFIKTMSLPFCLSIAGIIVLGVLLLRRHGERYGDVRGAADGEVNSPFEAVDVAAYLDPRRLALFFPLFAVALLAVFRICPVVIAVVAVIFILIIFDRAALAKVDYSLLATFLCFFVFAGNMARIPVLEQALSPLMAQWGLWVSALASQVISNVPAAVLLSRFAQGWDALLVGVNIGGAGTFVGSLASLIVIRHFMIARTMIPRLRQSDAQSTGSFLKLFGLANVVFFVVLLAVCSTVSLCCS